MDHRRHQRQRRSRRGRLDGSLFRLRKGYEHPFEPGPTYGLRQGQSWVVAVGIERGEMSADAFTACLLNLGICADRVRSTGRGRKGDQGDERREIPRSGDQLVSLSLAEEDLP